MGNTKFFIPASENQAPPHCSSDKRCPFTVAYSMGKLSMGGWSFIAREEAMKSQAPSLAVLKR